MLHYVECGENSPLIWRDPEDISTELIRLEQEISAAHARYTALKGARDTLAEHLEDQKTKALLDILLDEGRQALTDIQEYHLKMRCLQKEMSETLCLIQRM